MACLHVEDGGANLQSVHFSFLKHDLEKILGLLKVNNCTVDGVYKPTNIMSTSRVVYLTHILDRKSSVFEGGFQSAAVLSNQG